MSKIAKKIPTFCYAVLLVVLLVLFFTNDFGLVDIHKTSVVMAVGIDVEEDELVVTAQLAVPQPSESGENTSYTEVAGKGKTVSDALNEINSKTGFYPKLLYCQLILLGESCQNENIFRLLDYFYRNDYAQLTALVAMCKGSAGDLLAMPTPFSNMTAFSIQRVLSEELKKSANVSTVNLKLLAQMQYSQSDACYMPYIESAPQGSEETGSQGGEEGSGSQGGEQGGGQGSSGGESGGQSGSQGGSSSEGGESGSGGQSGSGEGGSGGSSQSGGSGGQESPKEFTCRKTAAFKGGSFVGILNEDQAFALNLIKSEVRLAIVSAEADGKSYSVGLKNNKGDVKIRVENEVPVFTLSYKAKAKVQDVNEDSDPITRAETESAKDSVLNAAEETVKKRMTSLMDFCREKDCDLLGAKQLLYKFQTKYYDKFHADLLGKMKVGYEIDIKRA